jgi:hypothetical protein
MVSLTLYRYHLPVNGERPLDVAPGYADDPAMVNTTGFLGRRKSPTSFIRGQDIFIGLRPLSWLHLHGAAVIFHLAIESPSFTSHLSVLEVVLDPQQPVLVALAVRPINVHLSVGM